MRKSWPIGGEELDGELSEPDAGLLSWLKESEGDFGVLGIGGKMGTSVGQMLVRGLDALGRRKKVFGISRYGDGELRAYHERLGIETIKADLSDPEAVISLPDIGNIVFLVGGKFGTGKEPERAWVQNVYIPSLIANRYNKSRIVVLSTGCVYPFVKIDGRGSREDDAVGPQGEYANTCLGRERMFQYFSGKYGTRVAIIRLNYANEFRYGVLVDIAGRVYRGEPVDITTPYVNVIWQRDAVSWSLQSLQFAASPPEIINITGPNRVSVKRVAELFAERFGVMATFTGTPCKTAWLSNTAYANQLFGLPDVELEGMVDRISTYMQQGGEILNKPTKFEVRSGKF